MSTTSRSRQFLHTLRCWALLPHSEGPTAPSPPVRPVPRSPFLAPRTMDVLLTVLVTLVSVWNSHLNPYLGPASPWGNLLLAAGCTLPLLVRRRAPELVLAIGLLTQVLHISFLMLPLAFYAEGAYRGPHSRRTVWASAVIGLMVITPWEEHAWSSIQTVVAWFTVNFVLACLVPLLLGLYVGQRRAVVAGLIERAERAEREQRLVAEAARAQERQRIAGEMHDVVSHQVSLIVVHANALSAVTHNPEVTGQTAQTIQTAGRRALTELREMVGLLRDGPAAGAEPASPSASASPSPSPSPSTVAGAGAGPTVGEVGSAVPDPAAPVAERPSSAAAVDRVTELVNSSRATGLPVALHVEGVPLALAEPVERAAYRVVQEALTNVHKHAPGASTRIDLTFTPETLRLRIVNAPPNRLAQPAAADDDGPLLPSGGHGLIGLSERVRLAGGSIDSGPAGDGGFRVEAALPSSVPAAPAA